MEKLCFEYACKLPIATFAFKTYFSSRKLPVYDSLVVLLMIIRIHMYIPLHTNTKKKTAHQPPRRSAHQSPNGKNFSEVQPRVWLNSRVVLQPYITSTRSRGHTYFGNFLVGKRFIPLVPNALYQNDNISIGIGRGTDAPNEEHRRSQTIQD